MTPPITFPGLGLSFTIDPIAFSAFGLDIHWYGIIIATGFMLGFLLANKDSKTFGIKQNDIIDLLLIVTPFSIIGARLYYVVFEWSNYKNNLLEVFNIRQWRSCNIRRHTHRCSSGLYLYKEKEN